MGSRSKKHGLTGIKTRQKNKAPSISARKDKLVAARMPQVAALREKLAATPELA